MAQSINLDTKTPPLVRDIRQPASGALIEATEKGTRSEVKPTDSSAAQLNIEEVKRKHQESLEAAKNEAVEAKVEAVVFKTDTAKDEKLVWLGEEMRCKDARIKDLESQVENLNNVLAVSKSKEITADILEMLKNSALSGANSTDEYIMVVPIENKTSTVGYRIVAGMFERDGSPKMVPNQITMLAGRPMRMHRDVAQVVKSNLKGFN